MKTRAQSLICLTAGCLGLSMGVFAAEVVIHPGNGVETNVAPIASASAVRVNPGTSGGGIVHLNAQNAYAAPTTLGCGTLVASRVAASGTASSLGKSGLVSIGAGTFRYDGPDGGWTDRTFTNDTPVNTQAAIYDIRHDLTLASDLVQARGSFVKTGPGTLHLAGTGTTRLNQAGALADNANGLQSRFIPLPNGDSPTKGFRGFHVLEGKLVLGENGGTYLIGNANNASVGGWTAERTQEVDATLEVVGGNVQFSQWFMHGSYNGNTNNTPERLPRSTLRVTGGHVSFGDCFSMGRNKLDYTLFPQRSAPRLEVYGGTMTISDALNMADDRGAHSAVVVTNGTLVAALAQTGRVTGNTDTTNTVLVTGSGSFVITGGFTNRRDIVSHVTVSDGGFLSLERLVTRAGRVTLDVSGGTLSIDEIECLCGKIVCRFDDATIHGRSVGRNVLLPDDRAVTATIGPGGLVLEPAAHSAWVVALPLASSGSLVVRGQSATATNVFAAAQAYAGSTRLERGTLSFEGEGSLPVMTDLTVVQGTLHVTSRTQSVRTLSLGTDGANTTIGIHVAASSFTPLIARSGFSASGTAALAIHLDGVAAKGMYPVLDVPIANRTVLAQLVARSTLSAVLPANWTASLSVVTSNGRALLVVNVKSAPDDPPPQDDPLSVSPPLPFDSDLFDEYVVSFGPTSVLAETTTISNGVMLWQNGAGGTVSNLVLGTTGADGTVILDMDASAGTGLTVRGTLDIRSPVAVRAHTGTRPFACGVVAGTYTALVYRATQTIDLSKFVAPADANVASVSYAEVTLDDGWKALVATIISQAAGAYSMGVRAWSETTTGGKWHSAANWTGWAPPDAAGAVAGFRPALAANVPVTLAKSATVGTLVLSGASGTGYCLSGETLALDAAGAIPTVTAETGTHEIAAPLALAARAVSVETCDGASVAFTGNMSGTNAALRVNRGRLSGGGMVTFGGTTNGIEKPSVGCGRTVVHDLSFATTADALRLGGGTLRYEGPDVCLPGLVLQGGNGHAGVLDVSAGRTVSIRSMTANATAFNKIGGGDLKLAGRGTFTLGAVVSNRTNQANTYIRANGDAPISTFRKCNVSQGRIVQGAVGDPSDAPVVTCSDFCVGVDSVEGEDCEYVMNNGILNASAFYIDYYHGVTRPCRGQFTLNGGAVTSKWVRLGQTGSGPMYARPTVVVNGGRWRVTGPFTLGYQKASPGATDCSVTVNGGELDIGGTLLLGRAGSNTGTVHLCGGVLRAENIVRSNGTARVYFDGGTYAPYGAAVANRTLSGLTAAYIGAGGATIDLSRAGDAYTVAQPLLHDPDLAGTDGGLRVTGGGTLVLAGANTYAGPTVLDGSTLDLNGRTVALGRLEGAGCIRNGTLALNDVLRPGGSGTAGTLRLDTDAIVTGIVEMELGDRIVGTGLVDVTDATLLVTDLNDLQRWNLHLLIHSPGGVRGTFAETNVEGSGYEILNTGTSLYLWNGSKSGGTTIFVR